MEIALHNFKPGYMSEPEVAGSDIYLHNEVVFSSGSKYLVHASSGHGKTSLLNFIYGTNLLFDGSIEYRSSEGILFHSSQQPLSETLFQRFRRNIFSYLFQDLCLFPELTALENVQLKNNLTGFKSEQEIVSMLDTLLPPDKKEQPVATLSLGQRQRVAVVRALCQPFQFLFLDEPFSHIDRENAAKVAELITQEVNRQNAGLIVTSLDESTLFQFDHILKL